MAAQALGVDIEKMDVLTGDTDAMPYDTGSYASSTTYVTGNAVLRAAEDLKAKLTAGEALPITGKGSFTGKTSPPPFIAGFAEVEVDTLTGQVELIDYVAAVDCGTVINTNLARIQVEGGLVQGIGMALYEDVRYTDAGHMMTNSFMQYKVPTRKDIHGLNVQFVPSYEPTGPKGAKSVGEVVINTPPPAIAHAIANATGVYVRSLPITPEDICMGILNANSKKRVSFIPGLFPEKKTV
jgi:CO/xanthine dehydrogenase Mo-binding subunit